MKKYLLLFLIFLIAENIQLTAQSYYGYTYTDSPTAPPTVVYAIIESCTDGSLIGTDYGNSTDNFALIRIGHDGGMLWKKMITLPGVTVLTPYEICLLKDSTVVVMFRDFQINNTY